MLGAERRRRRAGDAHRPVRRRSPISPTPRSRSRSVGDAFATGDSRTPRLGIARSATGPRPELRRRPQHGAPHRRTRPGRTRRPCGRDRRRARVAHAGTGRHRAPTSRRSRSTGASCRSCVRWWPTATTSRSSRPTRCDLDWSTLLARPGESAGDPPWVLVANLPYNVATPLICDLLDDVPAIGRMLVMVQREAAERFAAAPRTSAYGAVSVKIAYWAHARRSSGTCPPRCSCRGRTSSRRWSRSRGGSHPPPNPAPLFASGARPASVNDARCCAARSPASSRPRRSTPRASHRRRGPRNSTSTPGVVSPTPTCGDAVPGAPAPVRSATMPSRGRVSLRAHAKLTRSLRITGVRADGYHLIDAEMVSLDLHDVLTVDPRGHGLDGHRARSPTGMPLDDIQPRRPRAATRSDGPPTSRSTSRSPTAAVSAAVRPTLPRCCAGPASGPPTVDVGARGAARRRRPVLPRRRAGTGHRHRRDRRTAPHVERDRHARDPAAGGQHPGRVPGLGRPRRTDGSRPERPRTGGARRGTAAGAVGEIASASASAPPRCWPEVERPGSPRAHMATPSPTWSTRAQRWSWHERCRRTWPASEDGGAKPVTRRGRRCRRSVRGERDRNYLRRWWRVRRSIFLCFFFRMRLRRFLIREPIRRATLPAVARRATARYR